MKQNIILGFLILLVEVEGGKSNEEEQLAKYYGRYFVKMYY